jgi:hypothetical protein
MRALRDAQKVADALDGGILDSFRVFRQQLVLALSVPSGARHQVGKRAATVDPEIPGLGHAQPLQGLRGLRGPVCIGAPRWTSSDFRI